MKPTRPANQHLRTIQQRTSRTRLLAAGAVVALGVVGCGNVTHTASSSTSSSTTITVTNCGQPQTFPSPAHRIFVNDSNMTAMLLSLDAGSQVADVTSINGEKQALASIYGADAVNKLPDSGASYPSLEQVVGAKPDMMLAGYNYGYSETRNLMPDQLRKDGIPAYVLSESCRQKTGEKARGTMDPWTALHTDLDNLGAITGHKDKADALNKDIDTRLQALHTAPQAAKKPTVLMFDSGDNSSVFTSGVYGGPEGIIEAAGATSSTASIKDTWTTISWEKIAQAKPDFIVFDDYPGQTMAQKIALLQANPATRNLPAVKNKRYLNMAYPTWTSSPLNIDAAENLRLALQKNGLVPTSTITTKHNLTLTH